MARRVPFVARCTPPVSDPAPTVPDFTLTTFNAHWGRGDDGAPFDLAGACAGFDTDLVAVQEVWNPAGEAGALDALRTDGVEVVEAALAPSFVHPRPEITRDLDRASGTWGIALVSRLPVRSVRTVELSRLAGRVDVARRVALVVEVDVAGLPVTVATTHLSFVPPSAAVQLRRLRRHLPTDQPTLVAGDCNLWGPVAAGVVGLRRAVRGRTYPARRPHTQLDHVLLSGHVRAVDGRVLPTAGSDHLPVQAQLRVEG